MKLVIFAGGSGKRFWPISRVKLPKQFVKITNSASTLQLSVKRIQPVYGWHNIYISTNEKYVTKVKEQIPSISISNIFTEPARRDVGPAVGLALIHLHKMGVKEPVFIGWADHLIKKEKEFQKKLKDAEQAIMQDKYKIVLWGEKPKFANSNFGWISIKNNSEDIIKKFNKLVYRPDQNICDNMFKSEEWLWNTGYFVSTVDYLLSIYKKHQPEMYKKLVKIESALDTIKESETLQKIYPTLNAISFDEAVIYNIPSNEVGVLKSNMGWEDPGTLYALKKSAEPSDKNYIRGRGKLQKSKDSMIFNEEGTKLVVGLNLDETIIVNTKDVTFVTNKSGVKDIKELLSEFEKEITFKKYL
ncbi:hypothetical protein COV24_04550 [candidate division WWE3 bacterium CG10_big_fil_rev_8_21_14_0_10_32_10]|uniref:Nucleotidyl transferase domain-containing protein n=1 Tax=candidate division WWE3 bacterium CG10_big_fil_rev_8_21_14_0_10_32_10 TaxID=1975090 RepID=A0A2H0R966_UNCKA|nr:MAG: hypothetical protein COV24_04550 [candidate division WWE3 bacterium CG10_big_fil_rev_8_21_14_0_10_32_10]